MKRYEKLTATFIVVGDREDRYKAVEYTKFVEFYMPALVDARNTLASKGGER